MKREYINLYTGEIYRNLVQAVITIVQDMWYYKACRTWQMFQIVPFTE